MTNEKYLFEVCRGIPSLLSVLACGTAPSGGDLVLASDKNEAAELWNQYNRMRIQKRTLYGTPKNVDPCRNMIRNVIF